MLRSLVGRVLDGKKKRALKARLAKVRGRWIELVHSYDAERLKKELRAAGIREDDTLLVHANFNPESGFQGGPAGIVEALVELVGEKGNLLMVSIPFQGSAYEYLEKGKTFKVAKTMSMMGLVTETFRRREGTRRSLHPTHPVLAVGKDAEWLVEGHERSRYPCGLDTPYDKYRGLHGKMLFFDVGFGAITFFHHVEDVLKDRVPFEIYEDRLFTVNAIDSDGAEQVIETYAFKRDLRRAAGKLEAFMDQKGLIHRGRVGNSRYLVVSADDAYACHAEMVESGNYPYDLQPSTT